METSEKRHGKSADGIRFDRRALLQMALTGAGTMAVGTVLVNCGGSSPSNAPATSGGSPSSAATSSPATAGSPTAGGDLVVGVAASYIDVLDPNVTAQTVSHEVMGPIFDTLVYQDMQESSTRVWQRNGT